ncbi:MAG: hypothetical protein WA989_10430, partial [Henriciella sp.]
AMLGLGKHEAQISFILQQFRRVLQDSYLELKLFVVLKKLWKKLRQPMRQDSVQGANPQFAAGFLIKVADIFPNKIGLVVDHMNTAQDLPAELGHLDALCASDQQAAVEHSLKIINLPADCGRRFSKLLCSRCHAFEFRNDAEDA